MEWIAFELGVSEEDVVEMNRRMSGADRSLKVTMTDDSESEGWSRRRGDEPRDPNGNTEEMAQRRKLLGEALAGLTSVSANPYREATARRALDA